MAWMPDPDAESPLRSDLENALSGCKEWKAMGEDGRKAVVHSLVLWVMSYQDRDRVPDRRRLVSWLANLRRSGEKFRDDLETVNDAAMLYIDRARQEGHPAVRAAFEECLKNLWDCISVLQQAERLAKSAPQRGHGCEEALILNFRDVFRRHKIPVKYQYRPVIGRSEKNVDVSRYGPFVACVHAAMHHAGMDPQSAESVRMRIERALKPTSSHK